MAIQKLSIQRRGDPTLGFNRPDISKRKRGIYTGSTVDDCDGFLLDNNITKANITDNGTTFNSVNIKSRFKVKGIDDLSQPYLGLNNLKPFIPLIDNTLGYSDTYLKDTLNDTYGTDINANYKLTCSTSRILANILTNGSKLNSDAFITINGINSVINWKALPKLDRIVEKAEEEDLAEIQGIYAEVNKPKLDTKIDTIKTVNGIKITVNDTVLLDKGKITLADYIASNRLHAMDLAEYGYPVIGDDTVDNLALPGEQGIINSIKPRQWTDWFSVNTELYIKEENHSCYKVKRLIDRDLDRKAIDTVANPVGYEESLNILELFKEALELDYLKGLIKYTNKKAIDIRKDKRGIPREYITYDLAIEYIAVNDIQEVVYNNDIGFISKAPIHKSITYDLVKDSKGKDISMSIKGSSMLTHIIDNENGGNTTFHYREFGKIRKIHSTTGDKDDGLYGVYMENNKTVDEFFIPKKDFATIKLYHSADILREEEERDRLEKERLRNELEASKLKLDETKAKIAKLEADTKYRGVETTGKGLDNKSKWIETGKTILLSAIAVGSIIFGLFF